MDMAKPWYLRDDRGYGDANRIISMMRKHRILDIYHKTEFVCEHSWWYKLMNYLPLFKVVERCHAWFH